MPSKTLRVIFNLKLKAMKTQKIEGKENRVFDYVFYWDITCAWLRVPINNLYELKIADKISSCSYMDEKYAYLDEDHDAYTFITEAIIRNYFTYQDHAIRTINSFTERSEIRDLSKYSYSPLFEEKPQKT
jgi:hypothetical protein